MTEREALLDITHALERYCAALNKIAAINYCLCPVHGKKWCPTCAAKEALNDSKN